MNDTRPVDRPVNLDLASIRFPITAIASIPHRVCAVIIWVGLGFLLYLVWTVTNSPDGYAMLAELFAGNFLVQFVSWGFLTALGYYCMGGIKHLIQDAGYFEDFQGGSRISWTAVVLGVVLSILSGVVIWA
ncbi:MAG: succinate dehydrogenase, cytochrome b556 subunit [Pseudomonadota bacterium]